MQNPVKTCLAPGLCLSILTVRFVKNDCILLILAVIRKILVSMQYRKNGVLFLIP